MEKYTLRKIGKKLLPVAFGVGLATTVLVVNEAQAKEPELVEIIESKSELSEKITKEAVEKSKSELDTVSSKLDEKVKELETAKSTLTEKTKASEDLDKEITELEVISKVAKPKEVMKTETEITTIKEDITREEKSLEDINNHLLSKKEVIDKQQELTRKSEQDLFTKKEEVKKLISNKDSKLVELDKSNNDLTKVNTSIYKTKEEFKTLEDSVKQAETKLAEAKKQEANLQREIEEATKQKELAKAEVDKITAEFNKKAELVKQAEAELATVKEMLKQAEDKLASYNTIQLSEEYVTNLNKAYNMKLTSEERKTAKEILENINDEIRAKNVYKSDLSDTKLLDTNNLSEEIREELSLFVSDLVNQIRKQLATEKTVVTTSSIDFAKQVAESYVEKNADVETDHNVEEISKIAKSYGLPAGQYYENMASTTRVLKTATKDRLKEELYNSVVRLMLNGYEWQHAQSIAGINYGNIGKDYIGVDISAREKATGVHIITVSENDVKQATKNNFDTTEIKVKETLSTLKEKVYSLKQAVGNYENKLSTIIEDKKSVEIDKTNLETILKEKTANLEKALSKTTLTKEAQANLDKITKQKYKKEVQLKIQENNKLAIENNIKEKSKELTTIVNTIKIKQADLQNTKSVVDENKDKLAVLEKEKSSLEQQLQISFKKLEELKQQLLAKEEYLNKLKNTPKLKAEVQQKQETLAEEIVKTKSSIDELEKEVKVLSDEKTRKESEYNKLLEKYNKTQIIVKDVTDIKLNNFYKVKEEKDLKLEKTEKVDNENIEKAVYKVVTKKLSDTGNTTTETVGLGILALISSIFLRRKVKK